MSCLWSLTDRIMRPVWCIFIVWLLQEIITCDPTSNTVGNQQIPGFSCVVANCLCIVFVIDIETAPYRPWRGDCSLSVAAIKSGSWVRSAIRCHSWLKTALGCFCLLLLLYLHLQFLGIQILTYRSSGWSLALTLSVSQAFDDLLFVVVKMHPYVRNVTQQRRFGPKIWQKC